MPPRLPPHERRRINAQLRGHLPLRQAERLACSGKPFREFGGGRLRIVSQESDDLRHVADFGDGCVDFPVSNGLFVNSNLVGNLLLEEIQVQAARSDMVA